MEDPWDGIMGAGEKKNLFKSMEQIIRETAEAFTNAFQN